MEMLRRSERRRTALLQEADADRHGHTRRNLYLNYAIQINEHSMQLLHMTHDVHYQGVKESELWETQICTRHVWGPYFSVEKQRHIRQKLFVERKDAKGNALCGNRSSCWLCAAATMGDQIPEFLGPLAAGSGALRTIGHALQQWLHIVNSTFSEGYTEAIPLRRRWGGLRRDTAEHRHNLLKTSWALWFTLWNLDSKDYNTFVKLGGVRMPPWICHENIADLHTMVIIMEVYHFELESADGNNHAFAKFQAAQDIGDDRYAALWNLTLGEENNLQFGPGLSTFDKANAIDALIGLGVSCRQLTPDTRNRLYDEFGDLEEMSFFWQTLLNKFVDTDSVGPPPLIPATSEGGPESDPNERSGPHDIRVTLLDGEGYHLDPEHPFHLTPFMTHAVARSEAHAY